jgi:prolyl-tRNA synthetase
VEDFCGKLEAHLANGSTYLTGGFSAADVCVSLWLGLAMQKCGVTTLGEKSSAWMTSVLMAIKSYAGDTVESILKGLGGEPAEPAAPAPAAASGDFADNLLVQKLNEFGVEHEVYSHVACMTAEELVANVPLASDKETHTKNLFFKDKKHGMFLVCQATATTFNTKQLATLLNLKGKVNMRLADPTLLEKHLMVQPGHVGPLCIANDSSKEVTLVLDKAVMDYDVIHSHPAQNDASVKLAPSALTEFMTKAGVEPVIVDFGSTPQADAGGKAPANRPPASKEPKEPKEDKPKKGQTQQSKQNKKSVKKGDTLLALQWKKAENFPQWYSDVIILSEMISYYDISGCYILRPWSYKIWELIQNWFNVKVRKFLSSYGHEASSC